VTLDERIEALTQTVDLVASLHKDAEIRYERMFGQLAAAVNNNGERAGRLENALERLAATVMQNEGRTGQLMDTMNRVGRILEAYDDRLDDLDRRTRRLERPGA